MFKPTTFAAFAVAAGIGLFGLIDRAEAHHRSHLAYASLHPAPVVAAYPPHMHRSYYARHAMYAAPVVSPRHHYRPAPVRPSCGHAGYPAPTTRYYGSPYSQPGFSFRIGF